MPNGPRIVQTRKTRLLRTLPETPQTSAAIKDSTARACLIARDALSNLGEYLDDPSPLALLTVKQCEAELDKMERMMDEVLPAAITRVSEQKARELIASLRFIGDLERIGDLAWWVTQRVKVIRPEIQTRDLKNLRSMVKIEVELIDIIYGGFVSGDARSAQSVILRDKEIDSARNDIFDYHLHGKARRTSQSLTDILFVAQALERVGDHVTNLAEELIHLVEQRSIRHLPKKDEA